MTDRTELDETGIDELYRERVGSVHFEMLDNRSAFIRIGEERFNLFVDAGKMILKPE